MKGGRFVTGTEGRKVAVLSDLAEWSEFRGDIYDNMIAGQRAGEPRMALENFEDQLLAEFNAND
jgi:hypothetical protein